MLQEVLWTTPHGRNRRLRSIASEDLSPANSHVSVAGGESSPSAPREAGAVHTPGILWDLPCTEGANTGRVVVAGLGLQLLLLPLLLLMQIYSNQATGAPLSSSSSPTTSAAPNPANATTKSSDGALQSTASLFAISGSLVHLYC
ncbi:LOW QUALITY PROTEIN: signal transducer CD24 [Camelus dromedarius]|uniref:LOW QUALITY PROTEIN: signal transducer CD24 n=1 Tax=Camelus dromedarius TaxID=9838 RepID=UPI003119E29D